MISDGDIFITKLERGFFGAFRVLKTGGRFDFSKNEFYLIALTSYADTVKPEINDPKMREPLREKRWAFRGIPHINIYANPKGIIEKNFEYLGNLPLTKEEGKLKIQIGDGEDIENDGGFPLAGAVLKDFGFEAFLEWRWEHERELFMKEEQEHKEQCKNTILQNNAKIQPNSSKSISEAYQYRDDKSDKFWRIEYAGLAMAVNYGKMGTIGTYKVKDFDNEEMCEKEAKKLIASKTKKGYQPNPGFDAGKHFYLDDEETGLHPLTSHPKFRAHFTDEFYYDCGDEEAPFGSDEGSDTLAHIEEDFRKSKSFDFKSFPKKLVETYWGMTYLPASDISKKAVESLLKTEDGEMNLTQSDMVTYATAFAQVKITGQLDSELKAMALNAMKRMEIVAEISGWNTTGQPSEITSKMIGDLERFLA